MRKGDEERKMHDEEMNYKKLIIDLIEKIVNQNQLKSFFVQKGERPGSTTKTLSSS